MQAKIFKLTDSRFKWLSIWYEYRNGNVLSNHSVYDRL